jgi:biotin carboxyl carrier protein
LCEEADGEKPSSASQAHAGHDHGKEPHGDQEGVKGPRAGAAPRDEHAGHDHGKEPHGGEKGGEGPRTGASPRDEHVGHDHGKEPHAEEEEARDHDEHSHAGEGDAHERVVTLAVEAVRAAKIETVVATERTLTAGVSAPARVAFTQSGFARVAPRVAGRLDTIEVKLGQRVRKGTVLGFLESPELGRARADYLAADTRARVAADNLKREKELLEKGITSAREMREAESAWAAARADMTAAEAHLHALGDHRPGHRRIQAGGSPERPLPGAQPH